MHPQTRKLLAFLADEATDSILEELQNGPRKEGDLVKLSSKGQRTANRRLKELVELELVDFELSAPEPGKRGQRPRLFRIREPAVLRFCDGADAFALALAENRADRIRQHVADRRKKRVKAVRPEEESA